MRYSITVVALLFAETLPNADELDETWVVGNTYSFEPQTAVFYFRAVAVIGSDEILIRGVRREPVIFLDGSEAAEPVEVEVSPPFVLKGVETTGVRPGVRVKVAESFKVIYTKKVKDKTYYVVIAYVD